MNFKEIVAQLQTSEVLSPLQLGQIATTLAAQYAFASAKLEEALRAKSQEWLALREGVKSDTQAEQLW